MKTDIQHFSPKVKPPLQLHLLLNTTSCNNSKKVSLPEMRDGDDHQQVERHSQQNDVVRQCFDECGFGRNQR